MDLPSSYLCYKPSLRNMMNSDEAFRNGPSSKDIQNTAKSTNNSNVIKILPKKVVSSGQGVLKMDGADYTVKGHAIRRKSSSPKKNKADSRSKSASKRKASARRSDSKSASNKRKAVSKKSASKIKKAASEGKKKSAKRQPMKSSKERANKL